MNNDATNQQISNSGEVTLKELIIKFRGWLVFLLSKWKIILIAGVLGAALGFIYSIFKKPLYKAELTFTVDDGRSGSSFGGAAGLASQFGIDLGGGGGSSSAFSGDNLLEFMKSRSVIEKALLSPITINNKKITPVEYYINFNGLRKAWKKNVKLNNTHFFPGDDPSKFTLTQDSVITEIHKDLIKNNISVDKVDKKLSIITLSVSSKNELFSKYFTEILAKVVSDFYVQTQTEKESQSVAILQRQTDSVRISLNYAITGVASSADALPNANPFMQSLHVPSQKRQVDVQANTAILNELVKNLEVAKMSLLQKTPLIQIIDKPIFPLEKSTVSKTKSLILGGFVGIILAVVLISIKKLFDMIMVDDTNYHN